MERRFKIRKNIEFKKIYKIGKNYWNRNLILYVRKNKSEDTRVGFTISKKIGNAVTRNKIRRRMSEAFRLNFENVKQGYDLVFIPKKHIVNISYGELEDSMKHIMTISGVFNKQVKDHE